MRNSRCTLSTGKTEREADDRTKQIAEFWNALRTEDPDAAIWEVLEPIESQVTECLDRIPPRLAVAQSLTAQAMLFLTAGEKR